MASKFKFSNLADKLNQSRQFKEYAAMAPAAQVYHQMQALKAYYREETLQALKQEGFLARMESQAAMVVPHITYEQQDQRAHEEFIKSLKEDEQNSYKRLEASANQVDSQYQTMVQRMEQYDQANTRLQETMAKNPELAKVMAGSDLSPGDMLAKGMDFYDKVSEIMANGPSEETLKGMEKAREMIEKSGGEVPKPTPEITKAHAQVFDSIKALGEGFTSSQRVAAAKIESILRRLERQDPELLEKLKVNLQDLKAKEADLLQDNGGVIEFKDALTEINDKLSKFKSTGQLPPELTEESKSENQASTIDVNNDQAASAGMKR